MMPRSGRWAIALIVLGLCQIQQLQAQQRPNVLFIVADDLNVAIGPETFGALHTPNLDRLASEGISFSRAFAQYPVCGPSRASFMSGLYPETTGILGNSEQLGSYKVKTPALKDHPSMAGFFRENGYFTARVSKIFHMGVPGGIEQGGPGGDEPDSWDYAYNIMGPETLSDGHLELLSPGNLHYGSNFSRMVIDDHKAITQTDYLATSQAIAILESRAGKLPKEGTNKRRLKPDAPFFLAVGLVRPHVPFVAPERSFEHYPDSEMVVPEVTYGANIPPRALSRQNEKIWKMNASQKRAVISGYMASIHFMDEQVGRLLDALDRLNLRKNTIVVFISDHGYNLGEHDSWSKLNLWEESVQVPVIFSDPRHPAHHGTSNSNIFELIDLYPTLTELSRLGRGPAILQGLSFAKDIENGQQIHEKRVAYTITYGGRAASVRTEKYRYNRWDNGEELYDHDSDPAENKNLAPNPAYKAVLADMRNLLKNRGLIASGGK